MKEKVSIPCDDEERTMCPDRPMCFMVEFDGVAVCKGVLKSMFNSLPSDYEIIKIDPEE